MVALKSFELASSRSMNTTVPTTAMGTLTTAAAVEQGPTAAGTAISLVLILVSSLVTTFGLFFQKIAQERFDYANKTFEAGTTDDDGNAVKQKYLEAGCVL